MFFYCNVMIKIFTKNRKGIKKNKKENKGKNTIPI